MTITYPTISIRDASEKIDTVYHEYIVRLSHNDVLYGDGIESYLVIMRKDQSCYFEHEMTERFPEASIHDAGEHASEGETVTLSYNGRDYDVQLTPDLKRLVKDSDKWVDLSSNTQPMLKHAVEWLQGLLFTDGLYVGPPYCPFGLVVPPDVTSLAGLQVVRQLYLRHAESLKYVPPMTVIENLVYVGDIAWEGVMDLYTQGTNDERPSFVVSTHGSGRDKTLKYPAYKGIVDKISKCELSYAVEHLGGNKYPFMDRLFAKRVQKC